MGYDAGWRFAGRTLVKNPLVSDPGMIREIHSENVFFT